MLSFTYVTARKFVPHLRTITPFARLQLSKIISISREALGPSDIHTQELIDRANLNNETQKFVPFEKENPFESTKFKTVIEAKSAISTWLGYPLCRLDAGIISQIDNIVSENLDKKLVMSQVKQLFEVKLEVT